MPIRNLTRQAGHPFGIIIIIIDFRGKVNRFSENYTVPGKGESGTGRESSVPNDGTNGKRREKYEVREMSNAEKRLIDYLIREGGADTCKKCVYADAGDAAEIAEYGCPYAAEGGCIEGMTAYFTAHPDA